MASKRLTPEQIELMKHMVQQGTAPEDLARHFSIAISSVHNYKKLFKNQGLTFPDVRGKRPTGSVELPAKPMSEKAKPMAQKAGAPMPPKDSGGLVITVNGVAVHIDGQAKAVNIGQNSIEINF